MGNLFQRIKQLVSNDRYLIGYHASNRMLERGILEWQVVSELENGKLVIEKPHELPNPTVEVKCLLPDGEEFKAVWSYLASSNVAKLVTVHFFGR